MNLSHLSAKDREFARRSLLGFTGELYCRVWSSQSGCRRSSKRAARDQMDQEIWNIQFKTPLTAQDK